MKVKNIGGKVVSIGTTAILPDETAQVSDSYADNPAFTCLVEHGNLAIVRATGGKGGKKNQSDAGGKGDEGGKKNQSDAGGKGDEGGKKNQSDAGGKGDEGGGKDDSGGKDDGGQA